MLQSWSLEPGCLLDSVLRVSVSEGREQSGNRGLSHVTHEEGAGEMKHEEQTSENTRRQLPRVSSEPDVLRATLQKNLGSRTFGGHHSSSRVGSDKKRELRPRLMVSFKILLRPEIAWHLPSTLCLSGLRCDDEEGETKRTDAGGSLPHVSTFVFLQQPESHETREGNFF
ncbi:unnamed protein product [Pleuronectes platessa]|uniref:Uncharacterized protein n=1 Tax=Pleuronectes platessa TaxID=8262 RepID=A0A9N7UHN7_PLEPL|nr:unnamed protein product [Pleuronectes platessa]